MSRRRKRRGPRPPKRPPTVPSHRVDDAKLLAFAPMIQRIAARRGVAARYLPDLVQEALFQAWHAMTLGRFRVPEGDDVDLALRAWVAGVAFNQVMNWQARAFHRREIPYPDAPQHRPEPSHDPAPQYDAAEVMRIAEERFGEVLRPVFVLMKRGVGAEEIAFILDRPLYNVRREMNRVRELLAELDKGKG